MLQKILRTQLPLRDAGRGLRVDQTSACYWQDRCLAAEAILEDTERSLLAVEDENTVLSVHVDKILSEAVSQVLFQFSPIEVVSPGGDCLSVLVSHTLIEALLNQDVKYVVLVAGDRVLPQ